MAEPTDGLTQEVLRKELQAEYILIQNHYEAYDARALQLKALATPLLGAGIAVGLDKSLPLVLWGTIVAALALWSLEVYWKSFQYSHAARIRALESWFKAPGDLTFPPFQICASWIADDRVRRRDIRSYLRVAGYPFVLLPYLPVTLLGLGATAFLAAKN